MRESAYSSRSPTSILSWSISAFMSARVERSSSLSDSRDSTSDSRSSTLAPSWFMVLSCSAFIFCRMAISSRSRISSM